MASVKLQVLKEILPLLKDIFGFRISQINDEVNESYDKHVKENRFNVPLAVSYSNKENGHSYIKVAEYMLETDEEIYLRLTKDFKETVGKPIADLCKKFISDNKVYKETAFILIFMAAIFNRDRNGLANNYYLGEIDWMDETYMHCIRPDLLHLYLARYARGKGYHVSCSIKFGNSKEAVEIQTKYPWFEKVIDKILEQQLDVTNVKEAEKELCRNYTKQVGRKGNKIIEQYLWGTYHLLQRIETLKSSTPKSVTNEQCRFVTEYLSILQLIDPVETDPNIIRARINYILKKYDSIDELLAEPQYGHSPDNESLFSLINNEI